MDVKILVVTHKDYFMPHDSLYVPIRAGNALCEDDFGYIGDDSGDNISLKNPYFCELTALYWGWKNLDARYWGVVHYRRYLSFKHKGTTWDDVLNQKEAEYLCQNWDVVLPAKRRYWIETIRSHYQHTHDISHLYKTREILKSKYPDYLLAYDKVLNGHSAHMFNMFIMKKEILDAYCTWLFDILFELEKQIDTSKIDSFQARLFGRVSEILLDVWLNTNKIRVKEINYVQIGPYNFWKKVKAFLRAKFLGVPYSASV